MYNRYVPQSDGSFRKTKFPEPQETCCHPDEQPRLPELPCHELPEHNQPPVSCNCQGSGTSLGSFFHNLFPNGLDTEDLIVILLLLLLSQDGGKNGNRALLTLGAYLFLP